RMIRVRFSGQHLMQSASVRIFCRLKMRNRDYLEKLMIKSASQQWFRCKNSFITEHALATDAIML
ncbi:hypothetical protein ACI0FS_22005, partial [Ochrobactrum quorumnocens]|uniref:hypothetical protein n=1 Tax=Ochrobactrum quorumnocens TaxID=271865 RepID=UPI00385460FF